MAAYTNAASAAQPATSFYTAAAAASSPAATTASSAVANVALGSPSSTTLTILTHTHNITIEARVSSAKRSNEVADGILKVGIKRQAQKPTETKIEITTPECLIGAAEMLKEYPDTSSLILHFTQREMVIDETVLQGILESLTSLTSLVINGNGCNITGACFILQSGNVLTRLTKLNLSYLPQLNDATLQLQGLTELSLSCCKGLTGSCFNTPTASAWNSLRSLSLVVLNISGENLNALMAQAVNLDQLQLMSCPAISDLRFPNPLQKLDSLILVDLKTFTNEDLQNLLMKTPNIGSLYLSSCPKISQIASPEVTLPLSKICRLDLYDLANLESENLVDMLKKIRSSKVWVEIKRCSNISFDEVLEKPLDRIIVTVDGAVITFDSEEDSDSSGMAMDHKS